MGIEKGVFGEVIREDKKKEDAERLEELKAASREHRAAGADGSKDLKRKPPSKAADAFDALGPGKQRDPDAGSRPKAERMKLGS